MKVLIVSNLYPPDYHGGYELRCAQVAEYLRQSGHDVRVATSRYRMEGHVHGAAVREDEVNGVPVDRFFRHHRLDPAASAGRAYNVDVVMTQVADIRRFGRLLDDFTPDIVNWWNLEGLTKAILRMPDDRGIPTMHCIDDGWLINEIGADASVDSPFWFEFWDVRWGPRPLRPIIRAALSRVERRLQGEGIPTRVFGIPRSHACFISGFRQSQYQRAGITFPSAEVIYGGVRARSFFQRRSVDDFTQGPMRMLYAGYLDPERGLHTIVDAMGLLPADVRRRMHLSVVSGGPVTPDPYVERVMNRVQHLQLSEQVSFLGRVPHDEMPAVYGAHHMLVFPSMRLEGMPMVMMEAMCAGCAVPNTGSGGAIELAERAGAPLFPRDHPFALSRLLAALERDRPRLAAIALDGQRTVLAEFSIERMLSRTADALSRCARRSALSPGHTAAPVPEAASA